MRLTDVLDMAGVAGRRDPDRPALGGRLGGRLPDRVGHGAGAAARRADRREDERRAPPGRPRVPGPAHRPGLYGYVSATKWLSEIELTTLEAFDSYWVPRGWAKEAPILTQSRIDVPRPRRAVAGRHGRGRGRGLGDGPRDLEGGGPGRRRGVAGGHARRADRAADVGPVAVRLAGDRRATTRSRCGRRTATGVVQEDAGHADPTRTAPGATTGSRFGRLTRRRRATRSVAASGTPLGPSRMTPTPLPLRHPRPLRRRHRRRARQPDVLPPGPRRDADRVRRPREGPGRRARAAPGPSCSTSSSGAASRAPTRRAGARPATPPPWTSRSTRRSAWERCRSAGTPPTT